jgi:ribose 1,5-bisphosphokinase PhnN
MQTEALLITGPCGAGKSTVGFACLRLLGAEAVQAAMVDAELVYLSTAPAEDPHNEAIAEQGLAAVYRVYRDAGIRRLVLPRVLLYPRHRELVARAVPDASLTTVWLDVSDDVLVQRLEGRESGDGVGWHVDRARAVKESGMRELADFQLDGERAPDKIAADLLERVHWLERRR